MISDGETLDWLDRDGRSLSPPVTLYPVQGLLFDLTITASTSIVTMVYRCGFISTYTVGMFSVRENSESSFDIFFCYISR